jgi:methanogenic corrinoid protein MtbC1
MKSMYQTPTFNLKAVARETGVNPDTLRAWERRYGLPNPERTQGGHRIYSQRDIDIVKWLVARQAESLRIKQAVALWRRLEAEGREPLYTVVPEAQPEMPARSTVAELRQAWISACLDYDERHAEQVLAQAFALYPPETVSLELLRKGIAQIGQTWYAGHATVQQEHFATELATRRVEGLVAAAPPPTRPGRILAACPPEEAHAFGLLVLTFLLRRRGWDVVYLGADVPVEKLETTVKATKPDLAILAAQRLETAANLLTMAQFLREADVVPTFGGRIFNQLPALRTRIPGHFLSASLEQAPQAVEQMMIAPRPLPPFELASEAHGKALAHYRERQLSIEADVWQASQAPNVVYEHISQLNQELARNIAAALTLGDISFVDAYVDWMDGLGSEAPAAAVWSAGYVKHYYQAAKAQMDERGALIVDWLAGRVEVSKQGR